MQVKESISFGLNGFFSQQTIVRKHLRIFLSMENGAELIYCHILRTCVTPGAAQCGRRSLFQPLLPHMFGDPKECIHGSIFTLRNWHFL